MSSRFHSFASSSDSEEAREESRQSLGACRQEEQNPAKTESLSVACWLSLMTVLEFLVFVLSVCTPLTIRGNTRMGLTPRQEQQYPFYLGT